MNTEVLKVFIISDLYAKEIASRLVTNEGGRSGVQTIAFFMWV